MTNCPSSVCRILYSGPEELLKGSTCSSLAFGGSSWLSVTGKSHEQAGDDGRYLIDLRLYARNLRARKSL